MQEDKALLQRVSMTAQPLKIVPIKADTTALSLWEPICQRGDPTSLDGASFSIMMWLGGVKGIMFMEGV